MESGAACHRCAVMALHELDRPSTRGKARSDCRAGEPCPDHNRVSRRPTSIGRSCPSHWPARREASRQHFALAAEARPLFDREPGGRQRVANAHGDAPCGERRSGSGKPRERPHARRRPHFGIAIRCEAIEIKGVGCEPKLAQRHRRIGKGERQRDCLMVEMQSMQSGQERRPRRAQNARESRELRKAAVQRRKISSFERMAFDRNEMQPGATPGVASPRVPRREEVEPRAEAQLDHGKNMCVRPARREIVSMEEDVTCLPGAGLGAVIHVAKLS